MSNTQVLKCALSVMFVALFVVSCFAQGGSTKEAGSYQRSSVVYLNVVAYKSSALSNGSWQNYLVKTIQDTVRMDRFDYSFISQTIVDRFVEMPSNTSIEDRMNATIVPAILAAVDAEKEIRAQAMLSEQQRNSFITDKAKELGITEEELNAVMNSAYIFVPVYDAHEQGKNDKGEFVIKLSAGGYWWRIDNTGDTPNAILIAKIERTRTGVSEDVNRAFQSAVRSIAEDVKVATRAIPAFTLTGQILSKDLRYVEMSVGKNEGVVIDDRYRVIAEIDGEETKRGWVMVNKVLTDTEESKSKAQVISGIPYEGATVKEIPALPYDVSAIFVMAPMYEIKTDGDASDKSSTLSIKEEISIENVWGFRLKVSGNMANMLQHTGFAVPQLWLNITGEYLMGESKGWIDGAGAVDEKFTGLEILGGDISFTKKWYVRRFVAAPEIGFGYRQVTLKTDYGNGGTNTSASAVEWAIAQNIIGGFVNANIEIACAPTVNIGFFGGYNAFFTLGKNNEWKWKKRYPNSDNSEMRKWQDSSLGNLNTGIYRLNAMTPTFGAYASWALPSGSKKQRAADNVGE